ncbi:MAG: hypothetical protein QM766_28230 [Burkholderiaceae bacterium]
MILDVPARIARCAILVLAISFSTVAHADCSCETADAIACLGNMEDDGRRVMEAERFVGCAREKDGIEDLNRILPLMRKWAPREVKNQGATDYLSSFIRPGKGLSYKNDPFESLAPPESSPVFPLWALYRARMLVWLSIEWGPILSDRNLRKTYFDEARRLFEIARQAFPENRLIAAYLGTPIEWPPMSGDHEGPAWAKYQRESLLKLKKIVTWWIENRQTDEGGFGGGLNDDVEMWRWWAPVLFSFDEPAIERAQERLSLLSLKRLENTFGLPRILTDVEHANEDFTDAIVPLMALRSNEAYVDSLIDGYQRAIFSLMGKNERNELQFKSIYFNTEGPASDPRFAFDTPYHAALIQPIMLWAFEKRRKKLPPEIENWLDTWLAATESDVGTKPAGVVPPIIAWPGGTFTREGRNWWEPFDANTNEFMYNWPGSGGQEILLNTFLLAWEITGNEKYLRPFDALRKLVDRRRAGADVVGEVKWQNRKLIDMSKRLDWGKMGQALEKSDRSSFSLFQNAYDKYLGSREFDYLGEYFKDNVSALSRNYEMFTSEAKWTDRILDFEWNYYRFIAPTKVKRFDVDILYTTLTGDRASPSAYPMPRVRWMEEIGDLSAVVNAKTPEHFSATLYRFDSREKTKVDLWDMAPGSYELKVRVKDEDSKPLYKKLRIRKGSKENEPFTLTIPVRPGREVDVDLDRVKSLG